jgi:hypothetical protein
MAGVISDINLTSLQELNTSLKHKFLLNKIISVLNELITIRTGMGSRRIAPPFLISALYGGHW